MGFEMVTYRHPMGRVGELHVEHFWSRFVEQKLGGTSRVSIGERRGGEPCEVGVCVLGRPGERSSLVSVFRGDAGICHTT